jgi:cation diffusion facilitator family transporter
VTKEIIAQISIRTGKKIGSEALIADGWHHRSDMISSAIILIGAVINYFWWFDAIMGISVSLLILWVTYKILRSAASTLLGEKPSDELKEKIVLLVHSVDSRISDIHNIKYHHYGLNIQMIADFRLPADLSVNESHDLTIQASKLIWDEMEIRMTFHVEPLK